MRAYHHFSVNRSGKHLFIVFAFLLIPLFGLFIFSLVSGISFYLIAFQLLVSMWRLGVASVIAIVLAWVLVVLLVKGKTEIPAIAFFDVLQALPTFMILPIAAQYLGQSQTTIILFLIITVIWPMIFTIISSIKQVDQSWKDAVIMSNVRGSAYIRYYLFPVTTPGIVTGAIIGIGNGWEALIATEIILHVKTGLGAFFQGFANNSVETFLGIVVFLSVIFTINKLVWLPLLEKSHSMTEQ